MALSTLNACGGGGGGDGVVPANAQVGESEGFWPPEITAQPTSMDVAAGSNVTFTVMTYKSPNPETFQWSRNGALIAGATGSSYTLTSVQLADNASVFVVTVHSKQGDAISKPATLTVH